MITLLIASRNAHKAEEIRAILSARFEFLTLNDFPAAPKTIEDADTFAGNATRKAVELARWLAENNSKLTIKNSKPDFVLADDSGLEVDALNGAPGVQSARFAAMDQSAIVGQASSLSVPKETGKMPAPLAGLAASNAPDADNNAKLLRLLADVPAQKRTARFRCVLALMPLENSKLKTRNPELFDGICEGRIAFAPRGENGFGYDPLFIPAGFEKTFAQLGDEIKNRLSHRGKALEKIAFFFNRSKQRERR